MLCMLNFAQGSSPAKHTPLRTHLNPQSPSQWVDAEYQFMVGKLLRVQLGDEYTLVTRSRVRAHTHVRESSQRARRRSLARLNAARRLGGRSSAVFALEDAPRSMTEAAGKEAGTKGPFRAGARVEVHISHDRTILFGYMTKVVVAFYPTLTFVSIQALNCRRLLHGSFMVADMSVECSGPTYATQRFVSIVFLVVFAAGIPATLSVLLYSVRHELDEPYAERSALARGLVGFYGPFAPHAWHGSVFDTLKKLGLCSIVTVISPGSAEQLVFGIVLVLVHMFYLGLFQPYRAPSENGIAFLSDGGLLCVSLC